MGRKLRLALDGLLSFSKVPLRLPLAAGLAGMAFGSLAMTACLLDIVSARVFQGLLLGGVFFIGGGVLCILGILGEYAGRIYDQVRGRPLFVVKEQSGEGHVRLKVLPRADQETHRPAA